MELTVKDVTYVLGAYWQYKEKKINFWDIRKALKDFEEEEFNYYVKGTDFFVFTQAPKNKSKKYLLSLALVKTKIEACILALGEEKYWVCVFDKNKSVLPNTDIIVSFSKAEEILSGLGVKPSVITKNLEETMTLLNSVILVNNFPLKKIDYNIGKKSIALIILLGSCFLGFKILGQLQEQRILESRIIAKKEEENRIEKIIEEAKKNSEKYFERPFAETSSQYNVLFVQNILQKLLLIPNYHFGWELERVVFKKNNIQITYGGKGEFLSLPLNGKLVKDKVSVTIKNDFISKSEGNSLSLFEDNLITQYLYSLTANNKLKLKLNWRASKTKEVIIEKRKVLLEMPYKEASVILSGISFYNLSDKNFLKMLCVYGLIFDEITYEKGQFELKGMVYAKK